MNRLKFFVFATFALTCTILARNEQNSAVVQKPASSVRLILTVTDPDGNAAPEITKDKVSVYVDNVKQTISSFQLQDVPISLVLLFDISRSMPPGGLDQSTASFLEFMKKSNPANEYSIIAFAGAASQIIDFTQDKDIINAAFNKLPALDLKYGTSFFDGIELAVKKIQQGHNAKKVILIISDGKDNTSKTRESKALEMIRKTDVLIYAIGFEILEEGPQPAQDGNLPPIDRQPTSLALEAICQPTGGSVFYPRFHPLPKKTIRSLFDQLAWQLQHQYEVSILLPPGSEPADKLHRLRYWVDSVEVPKQLPAKGSRKVQLKIRGRDRYFSATTN